MLYYRASWINYLTIYFTAIQTFSCFLCFHFLTCIIITFYLDWLQIIVSNTMMITKSLKIPNFYPKSKDKQCNGRKKRDKMTNNDLQNTTQKTSDCATRTLRKTVDDVRYSGKVSNFCSPKDKRRITHVLPLYCLSAMHYKKMNRISVQVKLLLCVAKCRHIWNTCFYSKYLGPVWSWWYFSYTVGGSVFLGEGSRSIRWNRPTCSKSLTNFITQGCIEYASSWAGFEIAKLEVISTDCRCSCKSN